MDSQLRKTEAQKTKIMDYAKFSDFKLVESPRASSVSSMPSLVVTFPLQRRIELEPTLMPPGAMPRGERDCSWVLGYDCKTHFKVELWRKRPARRT